MWGPYCPTSAVALSCRCSFAAAPHVTVDARPALGLYCPTPAVALRTSLGWCVFSHVFRPLVWPLHSLPLLPPGSHLQPVWPVLAELGAWEACALCRTQVRFSFLHVFVPHRVTRSRSLVSASSGASTREGRTCSVACCASALYLVCASLLSQFLRTCFSYPPRCFVRLPILAHLHTHMC